MSGRAQGQGHRRVIQAGLVNRALQDAHPIDEERAKAVAEGKGLHNPGEPRGSLTAIGEHQSLSALQGRGGFRARRLL